MSSMKIVTIQGCEMIAAVEVQAEIERLTASRQLYRAAAASHYRELLYLKEQLDAIRVALHGAPDSDLVDLARATFAGCEMFQRLAGDGVVTRQMIMSVQETK